MTNNVRKRIRSINHCLVNNMTQTLNRFWFIFNARKSKKRNSRSKLEQICLLMRLRQFKKQHLLGCFWHSCRLNMQNVISYHTVWVEVCTDQYREVNQWHHLHKSRVHPECQRKMYIRLCTGWLSSRISLHQQLFICLLAALCSLTEEARINHWMRFIKNKFFSSRNNLAPAILTPALRCRPATITQPVVTGLTSLFHALVALFMISGWPFAGVLWVKLEPAFYSKNSRDVVLRTHAKWKLILPTGSPSLTKMHRMKTWKHSCRFEKSATDKSVFFLHLTPRSRQWTSL